MSDSKINWFVWFALGLCGLAFLRDVVVFEMPGLDPSWMWALNNISEFIPGKDWAFTYGPLGFMFVPQMVKNNMLTANLFNNVFPVVLFIGGVAGLIYRQSVREGENAWEKAAILLVCWLTFFPVKDYWELVVFVLAICALVFSDNTKIFRCLSVLTGGLLPFVMLLKFNIFVCNALTVGMLALILFIKNRKVFVSYVFWAGSAFLIGLILDIILVFGNVANFIEWVTLCLDISSHYSEVMIITGMRRNFLLFIATTAIVGYLCVFAFAYFKNKRLFDLLMIGLPVVFFSFKQGFSRQDYAHTITFFTVFFYLSSLLFFLNYRGKGDKWFIGILVLFQILFGKGVPFYMQKFNIERVWSLEQRWNYLLKEYPNMRQQGYKFKKISPDWLQIIGKKTIEALPYELSYLPANDLNFRFNPILQLYSAYSARLDKKSACSFTAENAPEFILSEFASIDNRNMFLDTPATWNAIIDNYELIKKDDEKALLQKRKSAKSAKFVLIKEDSININQNVELSRYKEDELYVSIDIQPTLWGRIRTFLFRAKPVMMEVELFDGRKRWLRLVPDTLQTPFPVMKIPENGQRFFDLLQGKGEAIIKSFAIKADTESWQKNINIKWYRRKYEK